MKKNKQVEIEETREKIKEYKSILDSIPENTVLARLYYTARLEHTENKLKRLLEEA